MFYFIYLIVILASVTDKDMPGKMDFTINKQFNSIIAGQEFSILLTAEIEPGWHIYWKNPGDAGLPTRFNWELPAGINLKNIEWQNPEIIPFGEFSNIGYENTARFIITFSSSGEMKPGDYKLKCHISWLICKEKCISDSRDIETDILISDRNSPEQNWNMLLFDLREVFPVANNKIGIKANYYNDVLILDIDTGILDFDDIGSAVFIPERPGILNINEQNLKRIYQKYLLSIKTDEFMEEMPDTLSGLLFINNSQKGNKVFKTEFSINK